MRLIERVTKEARDDQVWKPYPLETFCWSDWNTDSELWAFFLLAPFVWLWQYLEHTDWSKRNSNRPPEGLRDRLLAYEMNKNEAIRSEAHEMNQRIEAVRSYVRNLPPESRMKLPDK
jgi:hypothetical protein